MEETEQLRVAYTKSLERRRLQLAAARVFDRELARKRGGQARISKNGRVKRQVSLCAVMNAVNSCGRDVLNDDEYWKDQDRREFGVIEGLSSVGVMRNRFGRVTWRKVYRGEGVRSQESGDRRGKAGGGRQKTGDRSQETGGGRQKAEDRREESGGKRSDGSGGFDGSGRHRKAEKHTSFLNKNVAIVVN